MSAPRAFEILDWQETALGVLCLRRREVLSDPGTFVTEVTLDGEFLMSSLYTESERELARRAIEWHGPPEAPEEGLAVLVGGLGLGFTALEALACDGVASVEVVELLEPVRSWLERGWTPTADALLADERFRVVAGDVFARLAGPPSRPFDAIVLDVDHSPDELLDAANARFYTEEGLLAAREHLRPGGVLGVWSSGSSEEFRRALESVFDETRVERISWRNELIERDQVDDLFLARRS